MIRPDAEFFPTWDTINDNDPCAFQRELRDHLDKKRKEKEDEDGKNDMED